MPYEYEIDVERRLLIATFSGDATLAEAEELLTRLSADGRYSLALNRVYDCRGVTRIPSLTELRGVAALLRRTVDPTTPVRRALVVRPGPLHRLASVLHALLDVVGLRLDVFSNFDEAVEWAARPALLAKSGRERGD